MIFLSSFERNKETEKRKPEFQREAVGECGGKYVQAAEILSAGVLTGSPVAWARNTSSSTGAPRVIFPHPFLLEGKEMNMNVSFHVYIHSTHT